MNFWRRLLGFAEPPRLEWESLHSRNGLQACNLWRQTDKSASWFRSEIHICIFPFLYRLTNEGSSAMLYQCILIQCFTLLSFENCQDVVLKGPYWKKGAICIYTFFVSGHWLLRKADLGSILIGMWTTFRTCLLAVNRWRITVLQWKLWKLASMSFPNMLVRKMMPHRANL